MRKLFIALLKIYGSLCMIAGMIIYATIGFPVMCAIMGFKGLNEKTARLKP